MALVVWSKRIANSSLLIAIIQIYISAYQKIITIPVNFPKNYQDGFIPVAIFTTIISLYNCIDLYENRNASLGVFRYNNIIFSISIVSFFTSFVGAVVTILLSANVIQFE